MNTNDNNLSHNLYSVEDALTSTKMPKYLILLHKSGKVVYVNNITDVIQIVMLNKTMASIYKKNSPMDYAYHYMVDMIFDYTIEDNDNAEMAS